MKKNLEKYCRAKQATDKSKVQAHCMLDSCGYKHTLKLCNTHCFSTATMVARKLLIVTLSRRRHPAVSNSQCLVLWPSLDIPEIITALFILHLLSK
jgi:hypothetical protein